MKGRRVKINAQDAKVVLKDMGFNVRPSYCHDDYILTSLSLPYPVKDKLDRVSKKYNISRSSLIRMLIEGMEE